IISQGPGKPARLLPSLQHKKPERDLAEQLRFFGNETQSERSPRIQQRSILPRPGRANMLLKSVGLTKAAWLLPSHAVGGEGTRQRKARPSMTMLRSGVPQKRDDSCCAGIVRTP